MLMVFQFFQTFGFYGFAAWMPTLIAKQVGINLSGQPWRWRRFRIEAKRKPLVAGRCRIGVMKAVDGIVARIGPVAAESLVGVGLFADQPSFSDYTLRTLIVGLATIWAADSSRTKGSGRLRPHLPSEGLP